MTGSHMRYAAGLAGVVIAIGLAACGSTTHDTRATSTGATTTVSATTTTVGTGTVAVGTVGERNWEAALTTEPRLPRGPKGWTQASSPTSTSFINGDPPNRDGVLLGDGEALLEVRCSNTVTIYPTAYGSRSGPVKVATSTTGYPTGVTAGAAFHTALKPIHCVNPTPATANSYELTTTYQASELIPDIGKYTVASFAYRLSNSAAVQIVYFYRH